MIILYNLSYPNIISFLFLDFEIELDFSVGRILKTLENLKISEETLVIFSSDNGAACVGQLEQSGRALCFKI